LSANEKSNPQRRAADNQRGRVRMPPLIQGVPIDEDLVRSALDGAPVGIAILDSKSRFLEVNRRFREIVGYSVEELRHLAIPAITHVDDVEQTLASTSLLLAGEIPRYTLEKRYVRKDGTSLWSRTTVTLVRVGPCGSPHLVCVVEEGTERTLDEEARHCLAAVVESSDDAIISKTLDGVITSWNSGAERIFGYTAAEVLGKPITILIPEDHPDEEPAILQRLQRGERIDHYETVRVRSDGTRLDISLTVSPIRDANGVIIGASKIARDITRQKRLEVELQEHTHILKQLHSVGASIAGQLDLPTLIQTVTDAARRLSGGKFGAFFYKSASAEGQAYQLFKLSGAAGEAFETLGLPGNAPMFAATFRGEAAIRCADISADARFGLLESHLGVPGRPPVRSYLAVPVTSRSGEVLGGLFFGHPEVGIFTERAERLVKGIAAQAAIAIDNAQLYEAAQREIRTRERAEATLRERDRRKDEFLATLAHELRNPLAPIRQAAQIAKARRATGAQKRWSHDVIARQVQHMARLLDDLLDISRITGGTLELRTEMTDLAAIIDAAVETARPVIDAKEHELSVETPSEPVYLSADPLRLAQVLSNLLTNAAKYTDSRGKIRVAATRFADSIVVRVADNGIGIPPESLSAVFTMFSQVKAAQDRSDGGLGIGLSLSRGLVELHGGTIEARSAGSGQGSEFIVELPIVCRPVRPRNRTSPTSGDAVVSRRVLVADDNCDAANSLAILLGLDGHEVTVVHDGRGAIAAFDAIQPEVVMLDIGMPDLDGYEVARYMRRGTLGRAVTLIAITGWGQDSDKARALAAGFNHHFTKPIGPEVLRGLLRSERIEA
jgi:PAS domain S-box-containing protein